MFEIDGVGTVTYYILILFIFVVILVLREFYQMLKQKRRYFFKVENYIEWFLISLAICDFIPSQFFRVSFFFFLTLKDAGRVCDSPTGQEIGCHYTRDDPSVLKMSDFFKNDVGPRVKEPF